VDHGRFAPLLYRAVFAGLILGVMVLAPAGMGHGAAIPQLLQFAYALLLAVVLAAYLSHRLNHIYGLLAALFFLTTPPLLVLSHVGVLPLNLVFYWTSSLLCLFLWGETRKSSWLIVAGLCLGFTACGVAWNTALLFAVLDLGILGLLIRRTDRADGAAGCVALFVLCGALPVAGWTAVSYFSSGDVFVGPLFPDNATAVDSVRNGLAERASVMRIFESIPQSISLLPWGKELVPPTLALGPAAVCFLPWAFKGKWGHEKRILFAAAVLVIVFVSYTGALKTLGLLPIIPLLAVLAIYGIHNLYMNVKRPSLLFSAVALLLAWNGVTFWKYFG